MFSGYSPKRICDIIRTYPSTNPRYVVTTRMMAYIFTRPEIFGRPLFTRDYLASMRQSVNASSSKLAVAAKTIIEYLVRVGGNSSSLGFSVALLAGTSHTTWLRRKKPGKHVALGSPKLASALHAKSLEAFNNLVGSKRRQQKDPHIGYLRMLGIHPHALTMPEIVESEGGASQSNKQEVCMYLFDALLWILPRLGYCKETIDHSMKVFPQNMYLRWPWLIQLTQRRLEHYSAFVREEKIRGLTHGIECGRSLV